LKDSSSDIKKVLDELKRNLKTAENENHTNERDFRNKQEQKYKQQRAIADTKETIKKLKNESKTQDEIKVKNKNEELADPIKFVQQRTEYAKLTKCRDSWLRKIEIAELEAGKARAILRKHGRAWGDDEHVMEEEVEAEE
jgi:septal ring factor EnvC (AmiA/AmiB activator)